MNHSRRRKGDRKRSREIAGRVDLVELDRRLTERIGERKQGPGFWVAAVVRANSDRFVGAGLPFADRGAVHRHFVAGGGLVERQQVAPWRRTLMKAPFLNGPGGSSGPMSAGSIGTGCVKVP
jgi:hypothetical protein